MRSWVGVRSCLGAGVKISASPGIEPDYLATKFNKKGNVRPVTDHEGLDGEKRYSSILSLTSELEGSEG
jgi:hypothetical protein